LRHLFSGPLPLPSLLAKYNEVIPDGAERIMGMAERQSAHRERLEDRVVNGNVASQTRGAYLGFIIVMTAVGCGTYLIAIGKSATGLITILGSLGSLLSVFFAERRRQTKERTEKADSLQARRNRH
jgi:uncharacterized membrane protein